MVSAIALVTEVSAVFVGSLHARLAVLRRDDQEAALTLVEELAEVLQIRPAHPSSSVTGQRAQTSATSAASNQTSTDRDRGKQGNQSPDSESDAKTDSGALNGRLLVMLNDLDLAVLLVGQNGGVVGVAV
jgi:hypothetical protein